MPISAERIQADIAALARFTETPGQGITRPAFSPSWRLARDYLAAQLESAGCNTRIDAAGNLHARPGAISWDAPVWMSGSHLDTAANSGAYDGAVGIIAVLEALRAAREDLKIAPPLDLVAWADNDSAPFGQPNISSRAFVGEPNVTHLTTLKNPQTHLSYIDAGEIHGVVPANLVNDQLRAATTIGFIEVHVEQGPKIAQVDLPAACVSHLAGFRQYRCELAGESADAASTPMPGRRDALAGAAEAISTVEKIALDLGQDTLTTVSSISCQPNSISSISDQVIFTVDLRSSKLVTLAGADQLIRKSIERIATQRQLMLAMDLIASRPVIEFDARVCGKLLRSADARRIDLAPKMSSNAFHDAGVLSQYVPTAMLFVASQNGVSRGPDESARPQDIADATAVLLETVKDRRLD